MFKLQKNMKDLGLQPYIAFSIVFYGETLLKSKTFNIESITVK